MVNTDEWSGYNHLICPHATVCHTAREWARDDDGDGIREVHVNTVEGMWTDVRNFLRPFKGVHKRFLSGYVAMVEFRRNFATMEGRNKKALRQGLFNCLIKQNRSY